jgi:hypothetical protein
MPKPFFSVSVSPMLGRTFNFRYYQDQEDSRGANAGGGNQGGNAGGNAGGNQAGNAQGGQANQGANQGGQANNQPDLAQVLERLVSRNGGSVDAVGIQLLSENHGYRQRIRDLEGRVPAEGAVILAGEDAQRWQAYQALGQPTDVQTAITELTTLRRDKAIADAADAAGYKAKVLGQLPKVDKLTFSVKEESENGQTVKRAYVKDGDTEEPLTTYAERVWEEFLPVLGADTDTAQGQARPSFVRQQVGGKAPASDPIATHSKNVGYALPSQKKD